ncbi:hypothetical protein L198_05848 [Cryptococcus wingfieldii CBS 7118]|uniref:SET domain-containing protein n=1 Tax=Cryptococcus wingfieldii CBS 7118 TaxID=1295528 RepID=A0A1E3IRU9_9TREE|nr:hypothetical protein L198_05848 [Cryptococcus wingfieldii CBS 7118]ODN91337.1 hypothetical protein L198_05848 [Cryptococcus wingfieldii CBS 7118]
MDAPIDDPVSLLLNIAHSHLATPETHAQEQAHELMHEQVHEGGGGDGDGDVSMDLPSPQGQKRKRPSPSPSPPSPQGQPLHYLGLDNTLIRCICGFPEDDGFTIQCDLCGAWEHGFCVGFAHPDDVPERYLCEICDVREVDRGKAREGQLRMIEQARGARLAGGVGAGEKPRSRGKGRKREEDNDMPPPKPKRGRQPSSRRKTQPAESTPAPPPSLPAPARPRSRPRDEPEDDDYFKRSPWSMEFIPITESVLRGMPVRRALREVYEEWMIDPAPTVKPRKDATHLPSPTEPPIPLSPSPERYPTPSFETLSPPLPPVYLSSLTPSPGIKLQVTPIPLPKTKRSFLPPSYAPHLSMPSLYTHPTLYGLFAAPSSAPIAKGSFIGEYLAEVGEAGRYRRDKVNQYGLLGVGKPGVRGVGPPVDLVLDARAYGSEMRFVRSSCRPNAVLRVIIYRPAASGGKGKGKEGKKAGEGEEEGKVTFGIFASEDIGKKQEITLAWEWDDAHLVHSLPSLHPTISPHGRPGYPLALYPLAYPDAPFLEGVKRLTEGEREEVGRRFEGLLAGLGGVFAGCGCMSRVGGRVGGGGGCVVEQMMEVWKIVRGTSELVLPEPPAVSVSVPVVKEKEKEDVGMGEQERGLGTDRDRTSDHSDHSDHRALPTEPSAPHHDHPELHPEREQEREQEGEREEPEPPQLADLGPLIGAVRGWRRKELEVESVRRWRGVVRGFGFGLGLGGVGMEGRKREVDDDVQMGDMEETKEIVEQENDKGNEVKGQLGFHSPSSQPSTHSPSRSLSPSPPRPTKRTSVSPKNKTSLPLPLPPMPPTTIPPSSSLSPASSRHSLSPPAPPRATRATLKGVEEEEEDGESELSNPTDVESSDHDHDHEEEEEDEGGLSDATTITLPRSLISSSDDDDESEEEDGDEDADPPSGGTLALRKSMGGKVKRRIESSPAPEPKRKAVTKQAAKETAKDKSKIKKKDPFPFDPAPAPAPKTEIKAKPKSVGKPKPRLASVVSISTSASNSKPASTASASVGVAKKLGKKRQKRIVSSDEESSAEEEEERGRVEKRRKGKVSREREGGVTPPLPGATPASGARALDGLFRDDTPPPPALPATEQPSTQPETEKQPEPEPKQVNPRLTPPPPAPVEPPKKVSLSEYLKTHKFRKESQPSSSGPSSSSLVSAPEAVAVAVPSPTNAAESEHERALESVKNEQRDKVDVPMPMPMASSPMTSLPASTLNLLEHLPSLRNLPAPAPAATPAQAHAQVAAMPAPIPTTFPPPAAAAGQTPVTPAPSTPAGGFGASTSYVPRGPARTPMHATVPLQDFAAPSHPALTPAGPGAGPGRASTSYTPRQVSGEREKSPGLPGLGNYNRNFESTPSYVPRRERERSPVRERYRDSLPHQTPSSSTFANVSISTPGSAAQIANPTNDRLPPPLTTRDLPPHASTNTPSRSTMAMGMGSSGLGLGRVPPMGPKVPPTGPRSVSGGSAGGGPGFGQGLGQGQGLGGMDSARGGFGRGGYRGFAPRGWRGRGGFRGRGRGG